MIEVPSLWAATAPPARVTPPLRESGTYDVVIVGAGYTGLSTALHLAERGVSVCVLEAREPGWGASGPTLRVWKRAAAIGSRNPMPLTKRRHG